ncbi:SUN domain-containing protein 2-like isoform X2 [Stegodyphus dumicola]|uniref:SUN domain-containing protein 2-like isoform X2 n=1 Tax=Stegodyphus dumicola TaxID=202533 RepID=UPI0015AA0489|nr:SUN domain-containing protein 2-like isoform X2 [Stegodyphus dumicola]
MDLKSEITSALQLLLLLYLLYWSLTWNLPSNYDIFQDGKQNPLRKPSKEKNSLTKDIPLVWKKHTDVLESFIKSAASKAERVSKKEYSIIPSFNEWKEGEITKQEQSMTTEKRQNTKSLSRRKLNYASAKCGAKVLVSNPEARHKMAVLNEKADEYMLNPCRVTTWFVVELCDTIEITHIELANYELYSSSPKEFSAFWSDIYPTTIWHHLGSFEAKDQRTMQTFNVNLRNMGKFIKVVIHSHHGKEHYCPLSTLRILGYSMVYAYDETETEKSTYENTSQPFSSSLIKVQNDSMMPNMYSKTHDISNQSFDVTNRVKSQDKYSQQTCTVLKYYCSHFRVKSKTLNLSPCLFLKYIIGNSRNPSEDVCPIESHKLSSACIVTNSSIQTEAAIKHKNKSEIMEFPRGNKCNLNASDINIRAMFQSYVTASENGSQCHRDKNSKQKLRKSEINKKKSILVEITTKSKEKTVSNTTMSDINTENKPVIQKQCIPCVCENSRTKEFQNQKNFINAHFPEILEEQYQGKENAADSAALIQKESVLIRLTSRIKESEFNLNLINRYLQHLSQSYRLQMEDMQNKFNATVKAITLASEKAEIIDDKQQNDISFMKQKLNSLNSKVEYLITEQRESFKKVLELHAFFLILEFIIMSTIFTIFINNFQQRKAILYKMYRK